MDNEIKIATYDRLINNLEDRATKITSGKINCIPCPFPRFRNEFPGLEQSQYVIVTANTKVGKSKITDYLFVYNSIDYAFKNRDKLRIKIFYFTLELSADFKYFQFISYMLYTKSNGKIKLSPKDLRSTNSDKVLSPEILNILKSPDYEEYFNFFNENVIYISDIRNPTGINKFCKNYAVNNGTIVTKKQKVVNKITKQTEEIEIMDYYVPDDPDEYRIIILDHISLISTESDMDLHSSIVKLSSDYFVKLRNDYHYTIVVVQQQAAATESLDNFKMNKLEPSVSGLGDCKLTSRDVNLMLGLFSPFRHGITSYNGYDITKFKDKIRFLSLILNRDGESNTICPLLFEGAVDYFKELPLPSNTQEMNLVYKYLSNEPKTITTLFLLNGKNINTRKNRFWKINLHWRNSRIRNKWVKSQRNLFN